MAMWRGIILAVQFLTVLPLRMQVDWNERTGRIAVLSFPLVGAIIGLFLVAIHVVLSDHISSLVLSFLLLFSSIFLSGGLHADGWMDCSDAYFSYRDQQRRLEIMSDPRVGAFAVLSLFFLLGFRFIFMFETIAHFSLFSLFCLPLLSRLGMALLLLTAPLAKQTGMAAAFRQYVDHRYVPIIVMYGLIAFLSRETLVLFLALMLFYVIAKAFVVKQFGGVTGDVLGAFIEGSETFLWFVMWLLHAFAIL
ncbi:adenosylcobinamide-GDP ribazoletransferase [Anoxybacillus flavithermus]|uniref:adenosylcobinamide-GDP ribazoletransferase n=1 Tax=Anoxybacillus flavithermus TaxID=33934 RepID=UPI0002A70BBF|nr:adenosylcobinamide-GDP ribazoletransferase [Anoxybacillus flavithermus]ELK22200.1 cobalamin-5-phosphate synthase, CobS [Anoxybacillus flavithermus TNO-09.006]MBE2917400.1 adenosylcobinamide-GDP ribazoletransferase [Anoxybacillus flavithermus]MBE2921724.1 adenosylcobinamide-GDP ribazoletransferase [Anoxybacillus flavithermus]MBE2926367.1 adenosylcobinamide-GDP ribazoletransferase [Anoxybacillus flavithermus]MBE2928535.1 adenosylcobinamide-GDP ribazoletransferase [Anoxybacillus flavithermus]